MEWLKKLLEGKGLSDEQMKEIVDGAESNLKGYVPKHRFDEVNEAKKQLEADLKDRDKQLNDLKKSAGDNEDLKKQIEELQTTNKTATEQYEAKIKDMQVRTAIKLALQGMVHDPEDIIKLLDVEKIEVDENGTLKSNIDDLVKPYRESKPYLFVQDAESTQQQTTITGARPGEAGAQPNGKNVSEMTYTELAAYMAANPGVKI